MKAYGIGVLLVLASVGGDCSDHDSGRDSTVVSVEPVRGRTTLDDEPVVRFGRGVDGARVATERGATARVVLDGGARLLLAESSKIGVTGEAAVTIETGKVWLDAPAGSPLELAIGDASLRLADTAVSIERSADGAASMYVVRGEASYRTRSTRGLVRAGETLALRGDTARTTPRELFVDWTGGLAEPGPRDVGRAEGVGTLEGRVPDQIGEARWPLVVRDMTVRVKVVGDLAVTEVEQVFFNPASETVEGIYRMRIPERAVLHRFAVDRDGRLVDGFIREKRQAQAAYEAQVYQGSTLDPALLEWEAPGAYQARIYPIRNGESRRILVRYSEWLERPDPNGARIYRYRMASSGGAPEIKELRIEADVAGAGADDVRASHGARREGGSVTLTRSDFTPRADFVLELSGEAEGQAAYRAEHAAPRRDPRAGPAPAEEESDYFYVPVTVGPWRLARERATGVDLVIVADLSGATDRAHLELGRTVIESLAAQLGPRDRVAVVAGDLTIRSLDGERAALGPANRARVTTLLERLARRRAGGATDLGAMLRDAAGLLDPAREGAVVYVGDGAPTVGELGAGPMLEALARLPRPLRAYGIGIGTDANLDLLEAITRGAGSAQRVTTRAEAADAALALVAHVSRPVLHRVEVELGTGVDRVYPRGATDVVLGDVLPVIGRVRGALPESIVVRGVFEGRRIEERVSLHVDTIDDGGDLRVRWATGRLDQLLATGAQRTEIADLGTRFGIITPFTSFYVPSAAELSQMGASAMPLRTDERLPLARPATTSPAVLFPFALLSGCSQRAEAPMPVGAATEPTAAPPPPPAEAREMAREEAEEPGAMGRADTSSATTRYAVTGAPAPTTPSTAAPSDAPTAQAQPAPAQGGLVDQEAQRPRAGESAGLADLGSLGYATGGGGRGTGNGYGAQNRAASAAEPAPELPARQRAAIDVRPSRGSSVGDLRANDAGGLDTTRDEDDREANLDRFAQTELERSLHGGRIAVPTPPPVVITIEHRATRCSDGSGLGLDAKKTLWRERLDRSGYANEWVGVYERAVRTCEAPTARDRRALLDLIVARAGSISSMLDVYRAFASVSPRLYLRRAILARVRTPGDLRLVRDAFGANATNHALVDGELAKATDDAGRIRVLRRLVARFDGDLELALRLLGLFESNGRRDDARRLADTLRAHPLADAGVRTAIGEMYLRFGDETEARRVFSEIVEFAPEDELARRRLGDLYRAHGWFDEAYRQYETLATIRPDDPTVFLLLAQAAAGAGRIDEALRLEQRVAETAWPGGATGTARTAILWSSARLAELRKAARARGDRERLRAYTAAMRRGGVLREASDVRATLVWSHPDADVQLWAAHPGLSMTRPTDIAPELGIEAFDVAEQESGTYRFEVRRSGRDALTRVQAKLVVVVREGERDERVEVFPIELTERVQTFPFELSGDAVRALPPVTGGAR